MPREPEQQGQGQRRPQRRSGGKPGGGKPGGGKPYGGKPGGGKPGGGKPYAGKPDAGKPYAGKPDAGKPDAGKPDAGRWPADRERPPAAEAGRDSTTPYPQGEGPRAPREGRGRDRRVEYQHRGRPRGPRPQRGPWEHDRGPRPRRRDWEGPPRGPAGPSPAEVLGEDEEVVAGRRPVEEAFAARREARRLLVVPERRAALDQLVLHATTLRIPVVEVEGGTITAVTGFDGHQGVALVVAPRRWATLDDVLALAKSRAEPPFLLALDHLEDPQNVGTLLRSAEACGVHGVIFPTKGAAPISPAAVKTSAGAVEHLLLVPMPDLAAGLVDLHARGLRVIGADGDAQLTVREADLRGPVVIVTGSEGRGLHARVRRRVDLMARIPMRGKVGSLNASVAGSVFLFEAAAQRDLPEVAPVPGAGGGAAASASEVSPAGEAAPGEAAPAATAPAEVPAADAETAPAAEPEAPPASAIDPDDLLPEAPAAPDEARD